MLAITENTMELFDKSVRCLMPTRDSEKCIRLRDSGQRGLTLTFEEPEASDRTFSRDGRTVLAVPRELNERCSGMVLEMDESGRLFIH